ncbi:MAG: hypothetical protein M1825_003903 [Sarcosagium campestre]|nr:MAG: hypothetical protein M1825_003903 [Sarcosagium campestre]
MPPRTEVQQVESGGDGGGGFGMSPLVRSAVQGLLIFFAVQVAIKQFTPNASSSSASAGPGSSSPIPAFDARPDQSQLAASSLSPTPQQIAPIWPANSALDIRIYVSPSLAMVPFKAAPSDTLVLKETEFKLGDYSESREIDTSFAVPKEVQRNGTLWAHVFIALSGAQLDPSQSNYDTAKAVHMIRPLNQFIPRKKVVKTKNLLSGEADKADEANGDGISEQQLESKPKSKGRVISSYYHPNFTLSMIPDSGTLNFPSMHPALRQFVRLESSNARDASGQNGWYYPIMFFNTFWQLRDHMQELNSTVERLPLHIKLNNLQNWKFTLFATIDESMKQNQRVAASGGSVPAGGDGSELEEVKRVLMDTNVYLLATTGLVSVLHMVFEMLAFKSDISHWKNKKDNVGISVRTILANVFMQTVIFLYLLDNNEHTSWMILFGQGFGILLEFWKITKMVDVRLRAAPPGSLLPYRVVFEDKHRLSETEQKTKEYDEIAFRYLYWIAVPLLGAYAAYSVVYDTHKSWYSFVITTLVGSVYAYGFLMMVPSLYINYRLKSVAHMPAKAMTYKFLNTFIDDLFAWTIKMPTLHRLATLRDDVIFFIYLYQSWRYRVDYTRVNEFGQGGDEDEGAEAEAKAGPLQSDKGPQDESLEAVVTGRATDGQGKEPGVTLGVTPRLQIGNARHLVRQGSSLIKRGRAQNILREAEAIIFVQKHTSIPVPAIIDIRVDGEKAELIMQALPGTTLDRAWPGMSEEARKTTKRELSAYFTQLRSLRQPQSGWVGSCSHGAAYDHRLNDGRPCGPFDSVSSFHNDLLRPVTTCPRPELVQKFRDALSNDYRIVFTHADLGWEHILVQETTGHVTGIVDWEMAGWWPEYWEYNKARFGEGDIPWWVNLIEEVMPAYESEWRLDFDLRSFG